jgi:hypothetical protein
VKKMFPSPLALKPRFFSVARCRFAIRNSRPSPPRRSCILLVSENHRRADSQIRGSLRCLQTPTGWPSPPTHCRDKMSDPLILADCF